MRAPAVTQVLTKGAKTPIRITTINSNGAAPSGLRRFFA